MAGRKRPRRVVVNLPENKRFEYLDALMAFRDQNEETLYKVDLVLAIIKYHRFIDVTELCKKLSSTESAFSIMEEYLGAEFKKRGFDLKYFYNNKLMKLDCPLSPSHHPCPTISSYVPSEGAAIKRALRYLEDASRYPCKKSIVYETQNINPNNTDLVMLSEDPNLQAVIKEAEKGEIWLDKCYEALEYCLFNKIILNDDYHIIARYDDKYYDEDEDDDEDDDKNYNEDDDKDDDEYYDEDDDAAEAKLQALIAKMKGCKDGVLNTECQYSSIKNAISEDGIPVLYKAIQKEKTSRLNTKYRKKGTKATYSKDGVLIHSEHLSPKERKDAEISVIVGKATFHRVTEYLENRCQCSKRKFLQWGINADEFKELMRCHLSESNTLLSKPAPLKPSYGRTLTLEEKSKGLLYKLSTPKKQQCLHFIVSTGMWGSNVKSFMKSSGHNLSDYLKTDVAIQYVLNSFAPPSSRDAIKEINKAYYRIFTQAMKNVKTAKEKKALLTAYKGVRIELDWNQHYDEDTPEEKALMKQIKDGCFILDPQQPSSDDALNDEAPTESVSMS